MNAGPRSGRGFHAGEGANGDALRKAMEAAKQQPPEAEEAHDSPPEKSIDVAKGEHVYPIESVELSAVMAADAEAFDQITEIANALNGWARLFAGEKPGDPEMVKDRGQMMSWVSRRRGTLIKSGIQKSIDALGSADPQRIAMQEHLASYAKLGKLELDEIRNKAMAEAARKMTHKLVEVEAKRAGKQEPKDYKESEDTLVRMLADDVIEKVVSYYNDGKFLVGTVEKPNPKKTAAARAEIEAGTPQERSPEELEELQAYVKEVMRRPWKHREALEQLQGLVDSMYADNGSDAHPEVISAMIERGSVALQRAEDSGEFKKPKNVQQEWNKNAEKVVCIAIDNLRKLVGYQLARANSKRGQRVERPAYEGAVMHHVVRDAALEELLDGVRAGLPEEEPEAQKDDAKAAAEPSEQPEEQASAESEESTTENLWGTKIQTNPEANQAYIEDLLTFARKLSEMMERPGFRSRSARGFRDKIHAHIDDGTIRTQNAGNAKENWPPQRAEKLMIEVLRNLEASLVALEAGKDMPAFESRPVVVVMRQELAQDILNAVRDPDNSELAQRIEKIENPQAVEQEQETPPLTEEPEEPAEDEDDPPGSAENEPPRVFMRTIEGERGHLDDEGFAHIVKELKRREINNIITAVAPRLRRGDNRGPRAQVAEAAAAFLIHVHANIGNSGEVPVMNHQELPISEAQAEQIEDALIELYEQSKNIVLYESREDRDARHDFVVFRAQAVAEDLMRYCNEHREEIVTEHPELADQAQFNEWVIEQSVARVGTYLAETYGDLLPARHMDALVRRVAENTNEAIPLIQSGMEDVDYDTIHPDVRINTIFESAGTASTEAATTAEPPAERQQQRRRASAELETTVDERYLESLIDRQTLMDLNVQAHELIPVVAQAVRGTLGALTDAQRGVAIQRAQEFLPDKQTFDQFVHARAWKLHDARTTATEAPDQAAWTRSLEEALSQAASSTQ